MELTLYDIILTPVVTEKASQMVDDLQKITLKVHLAANKKQVKEALERIFNVRVKDVNIIIRKGKLRIFKRIKSQGSRVKLAIITLKDKESFDILTQAGAGMQGPIAPSITSEDKQP